MNGISTTGIGVLGDGAIGVFGRSQDGTGVEGQSVRGIAIAGDSSSGDGVNGRTGSSDKTGVFGRNDGTVPGATGGGNGVFGFSTVPNASGVFGQNNSGGSGVSGTSTAAFGVFGHSDSGFAAVHGNGGKNGVWGFSVSASDSGVFGQNDGSGFGVAGFSKNGIGVSGRGGHLAARFEGDVEVTGDIRFKGGDCAEDFDVAGLEQIEPGTVMVLDQEGALQPSRKSYDKKVVGVVSGAGNLKPGIILDRHELDSGRMPIALVGKVYCKVDAQHASIEVGDLLTTSPTPGHAMKADEPLKSFGAVIGKALRPLATGQGLVPILIALQ